MYGLCGAKLLYLHIEIEACPGCPVMYNIRYRFYRWIARDVN